MYKYKWIIVLSIFLLSACTFVNPEKEGSLTNSEQSTEMQQDEKVSDDELITYNLYPNPKEYFDQREIDQTLDQTDPTPTDSDAANEVTQYEREIYRQVTELDEVKQAGITVQEDQIYVAINMSSRTDEEVAIEKVKQVVENITDRSDITVFVDREFHNRIEDRKE
ncbi:YhcN/YlaJ family sporulation lipoprotein [Halalkalibacillus halophilus]|uniref:YhcN/YlaJ family sporulation lipoprotein n=1 Tax=Halalkalibacillus halophilus TaxID=392827 RepID=UPI0003FBF63F|nr:YhcN/YlaJ family sporulation lipoprotein [Halalkalibacillus halophilus]